MAQNSQPATQQQQAAPPPQQEQQQQQQQQQQPPAPVQQAAPPPAPAPPPPPPPLVVPAGASLVVRMGNTIDTKSANAGDTFTGTLAQSVAVDGVVAIPAGAGVAGTVVESKSPGRFKGGTILGVGVDVSPEVYFDLEKEASRAMSRD